MKQLTNILLVVLSLLLGSCARDESIFTPDVPDEANKSSLIVSFAVPNSVSTRANGADETAIHSCYIVAYDQQTPTSQGNLRFFEKTDVTKIRNASDGMKNIFVSQSNYVKLEEGDWIYLILNPTGGDYSEEGLIEALNEGYTHTSYFKLGGNSGVITPSSTKGLPMLGGAVFNTTASTVIEVSRMTAKISLNISDTADDTYTDFNIAEVTYDIVQMVDTAYLDGLFDVIGAVPVSSTDAVTSYGNGPYTYTPNAHPVGDFPANVCYPFAFPYSTHYKSASAIASPLDPAKFDSRRFCLLLYASRRHKYYRIDLYKDGAYLDLSANTHYKVNISKVLNIGYNTANEALLHPSTNIEFDVEMEHPDDGLISNGQFAMKVNENPVKTYIDLTHHPLRYVNEHGDPIEGSPNINYKDTTLHLATITRKTSASAPIGSVSVLCDMKFKATKIGAYGNIGVELIVSVAGAEVSRQPVEMTAGSETTVTFPERTIGDEPYDLKLRFTGWGQVKYSYSFKLGNMSYESEVFNYTLGYQYNSNEKTRKFDIGRPFPSGTNWDDPSVGTWSGGANGAYNFNFRTDNSTPTHWRLKDGTLTDKTVTGAAPVFADKLLSITKAKGINIRIIQAQPFYFGSFGGIHMCVASYNAYEYITYKSSSRENPSKGSRFTWQNAVDHAAQWTGEGTESAATGWKLPTGAVFLGSGVQVYELYHRVFHSTSTRGGDVSDDYKWLNSYAIDFTNFNKRVNFLPRAGQLSSNGYNVYWTDAQYDAYNALTMGVNATQLYAPAVLAYGKTSLLAIRLVKEVGNSGTANATLTVTPATNNVGATATGITLEVTHSGDFMPNTKITYAVSGDLVPRNNNKGGRFSPLENVGLGFAGGSQNLTLSFGVNNTLAEKTGYVTVKGVAANGQHVMARATITQAAGTLSLTPDPTEVTVNWNTERQDIQVTAAQTGTTLGGTITYTSDGDLINRRFVPAGGIANGGTVQFHFNKNYYDRDRVSTVEFSYTPEGSETPVTAHTKVTQRRNPDGSPKAVINDNLSTNGSGLDVAALNKSYDYQTSARSVNIRLHARHLSSVVARPGNNATLEGGDFSIRDGRDGYGYYSKTLTIPENRTANDIVYKNEYNITYRDGSSEVIGFTAVAKADKNFFFDPVTSTPVIRWNELTLTGNTTHTALLYKGRGSGTFQEIVGYRKISGAFSGVVVSEGTAGDGSKFYSATLSGISNHGGRGPETQRDLIFEVDTRGKNGVLVTNRFTIKQNRMPQPYIDPTYKPIDSQHNNPRVFAFRGHSGGDNGDSRGWTGSPPKSFHPVGLGRNVQFKLHFSDDRELQLYPAKRSETRIEVKGENGKISSFTGSAINNGSRTGFIQGSKRADGMTQLEYRAQGPYVGIGGVPVQNTYVLYFDLEGNPYFPGSGVEGYRVLLISW